MNFKTANLVRSVVIFVFCFGYVQNKRKIKNVDVDNVNSDINLNSLQLIAKHRPAPQSHTVITEDGYLVNLFRIPRTGPAVLMVHGIGDSSDSWLVTSPSSSLAYQLADLGYDIWLYNARGNKYSKGHIKNLPNKQYWDFSYEEMGTMDMPAVVDYIISNTRQPRLYYIGFSQGTTLFLIMCSVRPEYNEKIKQAVLLAPVAWLDNIRYPYIELFARNMNLFKSFLDTVGIYELFQNNELLKWFHARVCRDRVPERVLCELEYALSYGIKNFTNFNLERLPVIATHIPAGVSTRTFVHFFQIYLSKRFQRFDFGIERNMAMYSSAKPPEFNVSLITAPINLFLSDSDWFSTVKDTHKLRKMLPNIVSYVEFNQSLDFTHLEFVYGKRTKGLINDSVINILLSDLY